MSRAQLISFEELKKSEHGFKVQPEMIQCTRICYLFDATVQPLNEFLGDQFAALCIGSLGIKHVDKRFIILEFLFICADAFLPADQFIIKAPDLS